MTPEQTSEMEIVSSRIFAAPREVVFERFMDPECLAKWWGPKGFTNTFHEFDPRPGGRWRFTMHGPDGAHYETEKEFLEVTPPERIVFDHLQEQHRFQMRMSFEAVPEGTRLTWQMVFEPNPSNEKLRDFIVAANEENFDRLEACLNQGVP